MNAVCNVSCGSWYPKGARRLLDSLDEWGETADRLFWINKYPKDCPPHSRVPYAFKPYAMKEARDDGYEKAIWLDASCWLVRPLDDAWKEIEERGHFIRAEGWTVGQWCVPEVRDLLGRTQEELDAMTLAEGKMIGLDFTNPISNEFLDRWLHYADIGVFNGPKDTHRHDIVAAGIIAHDMGLTMKVNTIEFEHKGIPHPEVFVWAAGMS